MVICNLAILMAEKKINITKLSKEVNISRTTLTSLYYNNWKGIHLETINELCTYFRVDTNILLKFYPVKLIEYFIDLKDEVTEIDNDEIISTYVYKSKGLLSLSIQHKNKIEKIEIPLDIINEQNREIQIDKTINEYNCLEITIVEDSMLSIFNEIPSDFVAIIKNQLEVYVTSELSNQIESLNDQIYFDSIDFNW